MSSARNRTRTYHSPVRAAAAERTRTAIVAAAKREFERRGWAGATVARVAADAGVSAKTVEAVFGTKARLLASVVDFAIRGDVMPVPILARESVARMEAARDAATMLDLHAAHLRAINPRSARVAAVVEDAARSDRAVARLWSQMNRNRRVGVEWATRTLQEKPGYDASLPREAIEAIFWVALDWGTYRTLTKHAGLDAAGYEAWLRRYYRRTLLAR